MVGPKCCRSAWTEPRSPASWHISLLGCPLHSQRCQHPAILAPWAPLTSSKVPVPLTCQTAALLLSETCTYACHPCVPLPEALQVPVRQCSYLIPAQSGQHSPGTSIWLVQELTQAISAQVATPSTHMQAMQGAEEKSQLLPSACSWPSYMQPVLNRTGINVRTLTQLSGHRVFCLLPLLPLLRLTILQQPSVLCGIGTRKAVALLGSHSSLYEGVGERVGAGIKEASPLQLSPAAVSQAG